MSAPASDVRLFGEPTLLDMLQGYVLQYRTPWEDGEAPPSALADAPGCTGRYLPVYMQPRHRPGSEGGTAYKFLFVELAPHAVWGGGHTIELRMGPDSWGAARDLAPLFIRLGQLGGLTLEELAGVLVTLDGRKETEPLPSERRLLEATRLGG